MCYHQNYIKQDNVERGGTYERLYERPIKTQQARARACRAYLPASCNVLSEGRQLCRVTKMAGMRQACNGARRLVCRARLWSGHFEYRAAVWLRRARTFAGAQHCAWPGKLARLCRDGITPYLGTGSRDCPECRRAL